MATQISSQGGIRCSHWLFRLPPGEPPTLGYNSVDDARTLNPAVVDTTGELPPPIDLGLVEGVVLGESSLPAASCCMDSTPNVIPAMDEIRWPVDSTGFHIT